jgi:ribosomal protein L11 methyltransferase
VTERPDDTIEISLMLDGEAAEAVHELFQRHGGGAVIETRLCEPEDGTDLPAPEHWLRTYLPAGDIDARLRIEIGLWHLAQIHPLPEAEIRRLSVADWAEAWKAHYRPLRIGRRFVVVPSWTEDQVDLGPADLVLRLDPGMAFGTGLHPTTQLCLAELEARVRPGDAVLDVGTGSGILAIGAARLGAGRVVGIDIAPHAVAAASANAETNGVRVDTVTGDLAVLTPGTFDVVVANLLAVTITELAVPLAARVAPGGCLVASGVLDDQSAGVAAALEAAGLTPPVVTARGDWVVLVASRPVARDGGILAPDRHAGAPSAGNAGAPPPRAVAS